MPRSFLPDVIDGPPPVGDSKFRSPAQINRAHIVSRRRINRCRIVAIAIKGENPLGRWVVNDAVGVRLSLRLTYDFRVFSLNMIAFPCPPPLMKPRPTPGTTATP